ncbi:MAG TPA: RNA polymerase sigma factor [Steroidobacteraceae bacterium]|nr:RNA polymerase sigma factor [Steroidobacteraceae bacterium]
MPAFSPQLEPELIARARGGEQAALESVYLALEPAITRLVRRLVPWRAVSEDLAQDVFVSILESIDQYDGRGPFAGWARRIAVNRCLMYLRSPLHRARRWLSEQQIEESLHEAGSDLRPAGPTEQLELERALARLADTPRLVVWLHDVEGFTHAEIARLLGRTPSFSKSQLARAHQRLRELLEPDGVQAQCMPVSTSC